MFRIILVTQNDPFYMPSFLKSFGDALKDVSGIKLEGVIIQEPLGKKSFGDLVRQVFGFYGPVDFIRMGIRFAWKMIMNKLAVKLFAGNFPGNFSVTHYLVKNKVPIIKNRNINDAEFVERIQAMNLDLIVSVGASQKFKSGILNATRHGCINIHNSMLPRGRGMYPTFWALKDFKQHPKTAMSIFLMDEDWDAGPILVQEEVMLDPQRSLDYLTMKVKIANGPLLVDLLKRYRDGDEILLLPNDRELATYYTFPKKSDVDDFRSKGLRLI